MGINPGLYYDSADAKPLQLDDQKVSPHFSENEGDKEKQKQKSEKLRFTDTQKLELETEFKKNLTEIKKVLEQDRQSIRIAILSIKDNYGKQLEGINQDLDRIINLINELYVEPKLHHLEK